MLFQRIILLFAGCTVVQGDYIIPRRQESVLVIPESVDDLEKTIPHGADWVRLLKPESGVAKHGALTLVFRNPPETSNEIIMERSILVHLPYRKNLPTAQYLIHVRDLSSGRVVAHKFVPVQKSGWHKVSLNRWLGSVSPNHKLEIRLREKGAGRFDFEEYFQKDGLFEQRLLPFFLIYYKTEWLDSLKHFFNVTEKILSQLNSNLPAYLRKDVPPASPPAFPRGRFRRSTTPCSYKVQDMFVYLLSLNLSNVSPITYSPNTTKVCTGSCSPSIPVSGTSSKCNQSVQDCCVPSKRQPFIMLYKDKSGLSLRSFPDLIVDECACASSVASGGTGGNKR